MYTWRDMLQDNTALGIEYTTMKKITKVPAFRELTFQWEQ